MNSDPLTGWFDRRASAYVETERTPAASVSRYDVPEHGRPGREATPLLAWFAGQPRQPSALATHSRGRRAPHENGGTTVASRGNIACATVARIVSKADG